MPLAFESRSHGVVAFGFFNIDSDMLLLEQEFFFATDFCDAIVQLASSEDATAVEWAGYRIDDRVSVGDLMGAIHGVRFTGFIGETYKRFPFPERREDFVQKPEGADNRDAFASMIEPFAAVQTMRIECDRERDEAIIVGYRFERSELHRLVDYVCIGGYPRWRDGVRPDCVEQLAAVVTGANHWLFEGIVLTG